MTLVLMVLQECFTLRNYHATFAIVSALNCCPVSRLKPDWSNIHSASKNMKKQLDKFTATTNNYALLRATTGADQNDFCVPFLGNISASVQCLYLAYLMSLLTPPTGLIRRDLTFIVDGNAVEGHINFDLVRMVANIFDDFLRWKRADPPPALNIPKCIQSVAERILSEPQPFDFEDLLYEKSVRLLPIVCK